MVAAIRMNEKGAVRIWTIAVVLDKVSQSLEINSFVFTIVFPWVMVKIPVVVLIIKVRPTNYFQWAL